MQDILINWTPQETRVAVVENGAVQELHVERTLERGLVGNIYTGRVARVLPGMQSAFIDIGLDRAAFLHVADVHVNGGRPDHGPAAVPPTPIERLVFEGQTLMVQVIKDPIGTKGARLSTQISIAGRMLVFLPQDDHIGISQKIGSAEARELLRSRMQALVGKPEDGGGGGFILRTNAEEASDAELGDDIAYLRKTWADIARAQASDSPARRHAAAIRNCQLGPARAARFRPRSRRKPAASSSELAGKFPEAQESSPTQFTRRPCWPSCSITTQGQRPICSICSMALKKKSRKRWLTRRVDLKSGGYLIIDQTEATDHHRR